MLPSPTTSTSLKRFFSANCAPIPVFLRLPWV
jgi:hypothetical protein